MTIPQQKAQPCDDEFDFFELWEILWGKKLLIFGLAALCAFSGWLYATFHPGKPNQYVYTAFVEIGRYVTHTGGIQLLESPSDLVPILNLQTEGAKANVPRGSVSLISLEARDVDPVIAKQQIDRALALITTRHQSLASRLSEQLLTNSGLVAEPTVVVKSVQNSRAQIVTLSAIVGMLFGIFWAMVANARLKHRAGRALS
ncbi:Wzz/FepE/Etk N-terminal domain-containing protein [Herbaspirillum seropedicae]|uniref:Wzz/FepE/Etk N-terminal domain-containing protein n=1 Tax=Herbaspirillum seropedicae TaxID=964 RepID=UPI003FCDF0CF